MEAARIIKTLEVMACGLGAREVRSIPATVAAVKNAERRAEADAAKRAMKDPGVSIDQKILLRQKNQ